MKAISKSYLLTQLKNLDAKVLEKKYLQASQLSVKKLETATTGYLSSYQVVQTVGKNETVLGETINIPKDFLVRAAEVKEVAKTDEPVEGYKVGDKYIDFTINTKDDDETGSHVYIALADLNTYSAGDGIDITNGAIAVSVKAKSGLEVTADGVAVVAGNGIGFDTDGKVIAKAGDGITVGEDGIAVATGNGVKIDVDGAVALDLAEGDGIAVAADGKTVSVKFGTGLRVGGDDDGSDKGKLIVDVDNIIEFEDVDIDYDVEFA